MKALKRTILISALATTVGCKSGSEALAELATGEAAAPQAAAAVVKSTALKSLPLSSSLVADIPDNFDTMAGLQPYTGAYPDSPEDVGAFRFECTPGQLLKDDPIVYPGQPGKSHLHQFYGNTGANATSTYESLRTTGGTTCGDSAAPVNRSAYWMPAMMNGSGYAVRPDRILVYYKRLPKSDPKCSRANAGAKGDCVAMPNGLRFILGFDMKTMTNSDGAGYYHCPGSGKDSRILSDMIPYCGAGTQIVAKIDFPECWDGKNLDSANHRIHMSMPVGERCPDSHPYVIPKIAIHAFYTVDADFTAGKWFLSSDRMAGMPDMAPGSSIHMDYWEAWSPVVKKMWHDGCIDQHFTCSGGPLGNPWAIKNSESYHFKPLNPRLVSTL